MKHVHTHTHSRLSITTGVYMVQRWSPEAIGAITYSFKQKVGFGDLRNIEITNNHIIP